MIRPSNFRWLPVAAATMLATCPPTLRAEVAEPAMPRFDILEYDVEGNTRLSDIEIERAVTPWLGEGRTLRDVEAARLALAHAYADAGYPTIQVTIPEQKVDDGNVILEVTEGQVDKLHVRNAEYHLASDIRRRVPELAEGNVPYFPRMQRELDALNRSPDMKVQQVLKTGRRPGTVGFDLEVEDQLPLHGSIELDDHNTPYTRPLRLSASVRYDNLWQLGHSISLTAQTAPQATEQSRSLAGTYVLPVGSQGEVLAFYGMHSSSNVPSYPTGALGNTDVYGMRYAIALPATTSFAQSLSLGIDRKLVKQSLVVGGAGGTVTDTPSLAYTPLVASYNGSWPQSAWLQEGGSTAINALATLGMRGLLGNDDDSFAAKRSGASADFFSLRAGVQQTEAFRRWSLVGKLETQIASGPLVPTEQYAAGGADNLRGYQESELLGDEALRLAFELRTPPWPLGGNLRVTGLGFYEGARLHTLEPVYPQPGFALMRGLGVGLRVTGPRGLSFDIDLARALDAAQTTHAGDHRVHSRLVLDF